MRQHVRDSYPTEGPDGPRLAAARALIDADARARTENAAAMAERDRLRPYLAGLAPGCHHCVHADHEPTFGGPFYCAVDPSTPLSHGHACHTGQFAYDARPAWERYPVYGKEWWEKETGSAHEMRRVATQIASGEVTPAYIEGVGPVLLTQGPALASSDYPDPKEAA